MASTDAWMTQDSGVSALQSLLWLWTFELCHGAFFHCFITHMVISYIVHTTTTTNSRFGCVRYVHAHNTASTSDGQPESCSTHDSRVIGRAWFDRTSRGRESLTVRGRGPRSVPWMSVISRSGRPSTTTRKAAAGLLAALPRA